MKIRKEIYLMIFLIIVTITILSSIVYYKTQPPLVNSTNQAYCNFLSQKFDEHADNGKILASYEECNKTSVLYAGGYLTKKEECIFNNEINYFVCSLTFQGQNKTAELYLAINESQVDYEAGEFYRFNVINFCPVINSSKEGYFIESMNNKIIKFPYCGN